MLDEGRDFGRSFAGETQAKFSLLRAFDVEMDSRAIPMGSIARFIHKAQLT